MSATIDDAAREIAINLIACGANGFWTPEEILDALLSEVPGFGRLGIGGNQPPIADRAQMTPEYLMRERDDEARDLKTIDPERLCVLAADKIGPLLDVQFPDLRARGEGIQGRLADWQAAHRNGAVPVADEAENADLTDRMKQYRDFAGQNGEVFTARRKVKEMPYEVAKAIDAWFNSLSGPIVEALGIDLPPRQKPGISTMQYAQTAYLVAKAQREQAVRDRVAKEAQAKADAIAAEAGKLAESHAPSEAVAAIFDAAVEAEQVASATAADAAAPVQSMGRTVTAMGHSAGLAGTWDATLVDIVALCRGVAEGKVPSTFVLMDEAAVRAAVRRKQSPLRDCPGVAIAQTFAARRR